MDIQSISPTAVAPPDSEPRNGAGQAKLPEDVCREFEAVMTAALLKEGLRGAFCSDPENQSPGTQAFMELVSDQIANYIGRCGVLGLARMMEAPAAGEPQHD